MIHMETNKSPLVMGHYKPSPPKLNAGSVERWKAFPGKSVKRDNLDGIKNATNKP
jgi:hypothetical protein